MANANIEPLNHDSALRIVIADDHALVRGGLAMLMEMAAPESEILQANSIEQVIRILSEQKSVDLLLLDLMMPGMDGDHGIKQVRQTSPDVPIIIVSVNEDIDSIRSSLAAGAMGYIPKTSTPGVTVSAIKLVLGGGIYVPPHILNTANETRPAEVSTSEPALGPLTRRQQEVIKLIEAGKSNNAIAEELGLSTGTVKMHVSAIFKKLGAANRTEAVALFSKFRN